MRLLSQATPSTPQHAPDTGCASPTRATFGAVELRVWLVRRKTMSDQPEDNFFSVSNACSKLKEKFINFVYKKGKRT